MWTFARSIRMGTAALVGSVVLGLSTAHASELLDVTFPSRALGRDYKVRVYLPNGYKDAPTAQYPVIYLLHGAGGNGTSWTNRGGAQLTLDTLMQRGHIRPSIAVMPDNASNWYVDAGSEKAETAFVRELVPYIEANYKAGRDRHMRLVGGYSMGGYGAVNLSLKYPDIFCAAFSMSPAIYDPIPPSNSSAIENTQFTSQGHFDSAIWRALNYPSTIDAYIRGHFRVAFWIVAGDRDELGTALEAAKFHARLQGIQPNQVELRVVSGGHDFYLWREALPDALRYADGQCQLK